MTAALLRLPKSTFSGEWAPIRAEDHTPNPNVFPGDYVGLPMTDASRMRATAGRRRTGTLPEWQCRPHPAGYITRGPSQLRVSKEVDPVSRQIGSFRMEWLRSLRWSSTLTVVPTLRNMRPGSWAASRRGQWVGDTLKITTTHVKESYIRRSGVFRSDKATLTQFLTRARRHPDVGHHHLRPDLPDRAVDSQHGNTGSTRGSRSRRIPAPWSRKWIGHAGVVPHWLPGANTRATGTYAKYYKIPFERAEAAPNRCTRSICRSCGR